MMMTRRVMPSGVDSMSVAIPQAKHRIEQREPIRKYASRNTGLRQSLFAQ
jgi:hypothetical protein